MEGQTFFPVISNINKIMCTCRRVCAFGARISTVNESCNYKILFQSTVWGI